MDLPGFLRRMGVELNRSGSEYRLASDPYITVRGNTWYDQAEQRGGNAISFVKSYYQLDFPRAVVMLLNGDMPPVVESRPVTPLRQRRPFALPPSHTDMRRVFAYLVKQRCIPSALVSHFAKSGMLYESAEPSKDGTKVFHHAVFVGHDADGRPRHAHKRSLNSFGQSYRGNVAGSDAAHSFHFIGASDCLYVFEAPIDLMSYIALHPHDWQQHSYVALCGVSEHAMLRLLEDTPHLQKVYLCLDNDRRGIEACARLEGILAGKGYSEVEVLLPQGKDWNEVQQATCGAGHEVEQAENRVASTGGHEPLSMAME